MVIKGLKITILGASGSGKTTLAKALAERFKIAHFDSDDYFHYPTDPPFQKQRSPEDRLSLLMEDLNKEPSWVLSGGAAVWNPAPQVDYSLVIFLYLPPSLRLARLREREFQLYGERINPGGDMEKIHSEFMIWTNGYDDGSASGTNTLSVHLKYLAEAKSPTLTIDQPLTTEEQVQIVETELCHLKQGLFRS